MKPALDDIVVPFPGRLTASPASAAGEPDDVDKLLALARELSAVTTFAGLQEALEACPEPLLPSHDICILRCALGTWHTIVGPEGAAERIDDYSWTPLVAAHRTVGMLGIGAPVNGGPSGRLAQGAAVLLGIVIQNILLLEEVRQDSVRDVLTGCFNRRHTMLVLEGELRRVSRSSLPLSVLMIDVDSFKDINDRYGHVSGDAVLAAIGARLQKMLRQSDVRCRLGGDEFLIVLPDTRIQHATMVAESVRRAIQQLVVSSPRGVVRTTVSIGVASACAMDMEIDAPGFIDRADLALYRAKQAGRNQVACSESSSAERAAQPERSRALEPA